MIKTKQELLNHFTDINAMYNNPFMYQTLSNMIDELLEQQPCEDVLKKIKTEIEQLRIHKARFITDDNKVCIDSQAVLNVIDKYIEE